MKRTLCAVALVATVVATLVPTAPAGAGAAPLVVRSSSGLGRRLPAFSVRAFAPQEDGAATVHVHSGDVINIKGSLFLLPVGQEPASWKADNATDPGDPFTLLQADPDADRPGVDAPSKLNFSVFEPTQEGCGDSVDNPCDFDGADSDPVTGVFSPGEVNQMFVRITAQPNETIWGIFPVGGHVPESDLRIVVEPEGQDATTQAEVDEAKQDLKAQDKQTANQVIDELNQVQRHRENGRWVYDVQVGWEEGPVVFFTFFPQSLNVPKGSIVRYNFETNLIEPHTATFPFKAGKKTVRTSFVESCDPDGDDAPGPDVAAGPPPDFCDEGSQPELDITRRLTAELGDGVFPGGPKTYENSGLLGGWAPEGIPGVVGGHGTWDLKFTKRSGDKPFKYLCAVHGAFMSGSVKVHR